LCIDFKIKYFKIGAIIVVKVQRRNTNGIGEGGLEDECAV
jgi:hypothetical protein